MQCDVIWLHKRGTMKDQKRGKLIQDYQRRVNRVHYGRNDEILIKNCHAHICSKRPNMQLKSVQVMVRLHIFPIFSFLPEMKISEKYAAQKRQHFWQK